MDGATDRAGDRLPPGDDPAYRPRAGHRPLKMYHSRQSGHRLRARPPKWPPTQNVPPRPKCPPIRRDRAASASRIAASSRPRPPRAVTLSRSTRIWSSTTATPAPTTRSNVSSASCDRAIRRSVADSRPSQAKRRRSTTAKARRRVIRKPENTAGRALFVMKLSNSRRSFRKVVWNSSS